MINFPILIYKYLIMYAIFNFKDFQNLEIKYLILPSNL